MSRVVEAARGWIGTPYVHQQATKAAGCDCLGLLRGVWREVLGEEPEAVPAYSMDWSEPQGEERLWRAAGRHLRAKARDRAAPGDVLLFGCAVALWPSILAFRHARVTPRVSFMPTRGAGWWKAR